VVEDQDEETVFVVVEYSATQWNDPNDFYLDALLA
jgi:hypothetical protein